MSDAYDLELRRLAHQTWKQMLARRGGGREIHEGVYAFVAGPNYETRAECRLLRTLGADVVGMSTVPEVLVARHASMRVLALSLVTNIAVLKAGPCGDQDSIQGAGRKELAEVIEAGKASHEEVLDTSRAAQEDVQVRLTLLKPPSRFVLIQMQTFVAEIVKAVLREM